MADKRPTKTKLPETKIDLELPTSKGELVPYKKPEGGLSDTSQGKRATRNIAKGRGSAKRRALSALLELLVGTAVTEEPSINASIEERMNPDPQRVYHGTTLPLEVRESPEWYPKYGEEIQALGEWFTEDPEVASHFAQGEEGTVYPSYLNIKQPKVYETYEDLEEDLYSSELGSEDFRKKLEKEGYDGIEITSADTDVLLGSGRPIERRDFVAFEPEQIISSTSPFSQRGIDPFTGVTTSIKEFIDTEDILKRTREFYPEARIEEGTLQYNTRNYWDDNLEYNALRQSPKDTGIQGEVSYVIEAAGDNLRELTKGRPEYPAPWSKYYVVEKINRLERSATNRHPEDAFGHRKKLSKDDRIKLDKIKKDASKIPVYSEETKLAKDIIMDVIENRPDSLLKNIEKYRNVMGLSNVAEPFKHGGGLSGLGEK